MNKKTIVAASTAQAATPTSATTRTAASDVDAPQYSKSFHLTNELGGSLELVGVEGHHEGVPPIGSTMTYGQWQNFEVQYIAASTGEVWATYQVNGPDGRFLGDVVIRMSYGAFGDTRTTIAVNNSAVGMSLQGPATDKKIQPGNK